MRGKGFANDRVEGCEVNARGLSRMWERACQRMGGCVERLMEDEFEVVWNGQCFVVNWMSNGRPRVRSVGESERVFTREADAFGERMLAAAEERC